MERLSQKVQELEAVHQIPQHPYVPFPSPPKGPQLPREVPKHSIHTQTTEIQLPSQRETVRYVPMPHPTSVPLPALTPPRVEIIRETSPEDRIEIQQLRKQTRHFELRITELQEEIEESRKKYESLRESYSKVVKLDREKYRDSDKIAAISVLRDKLIAKDKEIDLQVFLFVLIEAEIPKIQISETKN